MLSRMIRFATLILTLGACTGEGAPATNFVRSAIAHGEEDAGDAAVVALVNEQGIFCSGVAVAAHLVLTAAHCVELGPEEVFSYQEPYPASHAQIARAEVHPDYSRVSLEHDLGALVLSEPASAFAPLPPLVRGAGSVGARVRLAGFGATAALADDIGEKRTGYSSITAIDPSTLRLSAVPATSCGGDSGGPVYLQEGADERLVALTSSGDGACEDYSRAVRLAAHAPFIEAMFVNAQGGERSPGCSLSLAPSEVTPAATAVAVLAALIAFRSRSRRNPQL